MLKKLNFITLIILSSILLNACEQDDIVNVKSQENPKPLNFKIEFAEQLYKNDKTLKTITGKIKNNKWTSNYSNQYNFGIFESKVQVLDHDLYTQYTFEMYRDSISTLQLENYILKLYNDGNVEQLIVKYDVNTDNSYSFNDINVISDPSLVSAWTAGCFPELVGSFEQTACRSIYCSVPGHEDGGNGCGNNPDNGGTPNPELGEICETYTVYIYAENCGGGGNESPIPPMPGEPSNYGGGGSNTGSTSSNTSGTNTYSKPFTLLSQCTRDAISALPQGTQDWINGLNCDNTALAGTSDCKQDMYDNATSYISANAEGCELNTEDEGFINAVKEAFEDNSDVEVDWEDRIIFDNIPECMKKIINELKNPNSSGIMPNLPSSSYDTFPDYMLNLFQTDIKNHLKFSISTNLANNINARTTPSSNANSILYDIEINQSYLNNSTDLALARTLIHEIIHAYFLFINQNYPFSNFSQELMNLISSNGGSTPDAHHQAMLQFVDLMADALQNWNEQNGNFILNSDYYKYLSWSGDMLNTNDFNILPNSFQTNVINANVAEGQANQSSNSSALSINNCN